MKNLLYILVFLLAGLVDVSGQTEKLDKLFQEFEKNGGATSINIKKPMFSLLSNFDLDLNDDYMKKLKPLMSQVESIKMLVIPKATYPDNLKGDNLQNELLNNQKVDKVKKALDELSFDELMTVNNNGTTMKFLAESEKNNVLENLVLNVDSKGENVIFLLNGKMKMEDVNKMISSTNFSFSKTASTKNNVQENDSSYLNGEARNVENFSGVVVKTGVKVVFKQENSKSVKVIADADKLQYVVTKVENGILKIYIDNKGVKNLRFKNLSVNISNPTLNSVEGSSGGNFQTDGVVSTKDLVLSASSGSRIQGDFKVNGKADVNTSSGSNIKVNIQANSLAFDGSSGSSTTLEGSADTMKFGISSGSSCKAENFVVNEAEGTSTSGSSISLNVTKKLWVEASSGGSIRYKGNPSVTSSISKNSGGSLVQIK